MGTLGAKIWSFLQAFLVVGIFFVLSTILTVRIELPLKDAIQDLLPHEPVCFASTDFPRLLWGAQKEMWFLSLEVLRISMSTVMLAFALVFIGSFLSGKKPNKFSATCGLFCDLGLSKKFWTVQAALVIIFLGQLYTQWLCGRWLFTMRNIYREGERIEYGTLFTAILSAPFREELLFRGVVFHVLLRSWKSARDAVLASNVLFGLLHLMNLSASSLSSLYVVGQVLLGFEVGCFYGLLVARTGNLWESILLHASNNLFSLGIPFDIDVNDPLIASYLIFAFGFYFVLLRSEWTISKSSPPVVASSTALPRPKSE